MSSRPGRAEVFRYVQHDWDADSRRLLCRYDLDGETFEEAFTFTPTDADLALGTAPDPEDLEAAFRLVFLLAGMSYYKAGAPPVVDLGTTATTASERELLRASLVEGLGEYAHKNQLDLSDVRFEGPTATPAPVGPPPAEPVRPLIPFGGGVDSIVTVEGLRPVVEDAALFVVTRGETPFAAIENAAEVAGFPIARVRRQLDPKILQSRQRGYLDGHVPVTGILSTLAVATAVLSGRDAVVLSNERSASDGNVVVDGREVNHQWSKSIHFERLLRDALAEGGPSGVAYYSWLRDASALWIADRFARLTDYHRVFRSCNRNFTIDPERRLSEWCGVCDKCCFVDLVLAPFLPAAELDAIFHGREPLQNPDLLEQFRVLLGLVEAPKPFECVGDVDECQEAAVLAHARRTGDAVGLLAPLHAELSERSLAPATLPTAWRVPSGPHHIPRSHAASDVR